MFFFVEITFSKRQRSLGTVSRCTIDLAQKVVCLLLGVLLILNTREIHHQAEIFLLSDSLFVMYVKILQSVLEGRAFYSNQTRLIYKYFKRALILRKFNLIQLITRTMRDPLVCYSIIPHCVPFYTAYSILCPLLFCTTPLRIFCIPFFPMFYNSLLCILFSSVLKSLPCIPYSILFCNYAFLFSTTLPRIPCYVPRHFFFLYHNYLL